ncbi:MAG: peptidoglycan-binding domain-containing protein [Alphaproteobacteria bacterium]
MRHKNGKPTKAKRAGKKSAAASSRARRKAAPRSDKMQESSAAKSTESTASAAPAKRKRRRRAGQGTNPPPLSIGPAVSTSPSSAEQEPIGPALPASAAPVTGERRRGSERSRPATNYSDGKRAKFDSRRESSESDDPPPRANKLMPTNAVHPTERRIKRRMHKNGALIAAAGAALLGVLILSNQSEPPELILSDRQLASRLPSGRDWQSDATPDTEYKATRRTDTPTGDSTRFTALTPLERQQTTVKKSQLASRPRPSVSKNGLSSGDIAEMERMLSRLDLATGTPDGVFDDDTEQAIRLYQEFAGLHVDGEASKHLLADMREVVKILDGDN